MTHTTQFNDDDFNVLSAAEIARLLASGRTLRFQTKREFEYLRDRVRSLEARVWRLEQDRH